MPDVVAYLWQCGEVREIKLKELNGQVVGTVEFMTKVSHFET